MNNEVLLPAVLGITFGLLLVAVAAYRSANDPRDGARRRAAAAALLLYAVLAVPFFARGGMTLLWLLVLLVVVVLTFVAASLSARREVTLTAGQRMVSAAVGIALAALLLISAAQTISLLTRVDPRTLVVVLAVVTGLVAALQGLAAAGRLGSTAIWLLLFPIAVSLALGFFLGGFGEVVSPIVPVDGPSVMVIVGLACALFVIAWADPGLGALSRPFAGQRRSVTVILVAALGVVVLIGLGQLMFLGGSVLAPSMQFFVVPSNLDIVPALIAVVLTVLTMVFAALVTIPLAGVAALADEGKAAKWVLAATVIAALLALADPGAERIIIAASLIGAAYLGAQLSASRTDRGLWAGVAAAVVGTALLAVLGQLEFGVVSILVLAAVAAVAAVVARADEGSEVTASA